MVIYANTPKFACHIGNQSKEAQKEETNFFSLFEEGNSESDEDFAPDFDLSGHDDVS